MEILASGARVEGSTSRWTEALSRQPAVLVAAVIALGAALRFACLSQNSIWADEAYVAWLTRFGWRDLLSIVRASDAHPPLYYLLVKAWVGVAGTGEVALRVPSACASTLSIPLTYALMRRLFPAPAGLLAALLVSVSPLEVMAGQEARMYPLLGVLTLASTLALLLSIETGKARWRIGYAALGTLMLYTHYLGALVLIAHGCWVAVYERPRIAGWAAGLAVIGLLFSPWLPSCWHQITHVHGYAAYRETATYLDPGDLLGLFAFGGSLFGMSSYFFPGSVGLGRQLIATLPFIAVPAAAFLAARRDARGLMLLGLPLLVTLGLMFAVTLVRPMFYPRWFSYLLPFYAAFLALGIVELAARGRSYHRAVAATLTIGLLLYSVPVLQHYYTDPAFRPYRWRAAAALVEKYARPEDFFLFSNAAAERSLSYYYRQPHPSLTVDVMGDARSTGRPLPLTPDQATELSLRYPHVWLVTTLPFKAPMAEDLRQALGGAFRVVGGRDFAGVWVHLLEAKSSRR